MEERLDYSKLAPKGYRAMLALDSYVGGCELEPLLKELVRMRASQINGCTYCMDMHSKDALAQGESTHRLFTLSAWRETPFFSEREQAALMWTEEITLVSETHAREEVYAKVREHFSEEEIVNLTLTIIMINGWNRICIAFRDVPGSYVSDKTPVVSEAIMV
ncbi:MAG: carboxymuconolactone decarboxylase family protein [Chloroflexia bacterium]